MFLYGSRQLGVQYSYIEPNSSPFNVWFEGAIVYFCRSLVIAFGGIEDIVSAKASGDLANLFGEAE